MSMKFLLLCCVALFLMSTSCSFAQKSNSSEEAIKSKEPVKAESKSSASGGEDFAVGKYAFNLQEKDGKCVLSYKNSGKSQEVILDILPVCKVVRGNNEKARSFNYKDLKADIFMIVGGVEDKSGKECGNQAQVVLVKDHAVSPGKTQQGAVCVLYGTDEKDFWLLSHS